MSEQSRVDPNFEYDAPSYVDFDLLKQGVDDVNADLWFENHLDPDDNLLKEEGRRFFTVVDTCSKNASEPQVMKLVNQFDNDDKAPEKSSCSVEQGRDKEAVSKPVIASELIRMVQQNNNKLKRKSARGIPQAVEKLLRKPLRSSNKVNITVSEQGPVSLKKVQMMSSDLVTIPKTLQVLSGYRQEKKKPLTTEELEMEQIEMLKKDAQRTLQQSKRSFQMLGKASELNATKCNKPTTEPVEFSFKTNERCAHHTPAVDKSFNINPSNFPMLLRNSSKDQKSNSAISSSDNIGGGTEIKPFKFMLDERISKGPKALNHDSYIPTAEAVERFQKQTPPRFHSNPAKSIAQPPSKGEKTLELTVPKTPKLCARNRTRPTTVVSAVEAEEEEIAKLKEYKFKANPINPKVFSKNGLYGVPKRSEDHPHVTVPESPQLATKERIEARKRKADEDTNGSYEFHAHPIPKGILEGVKGVPEKPAPFLTHAVSPAFALKRRKLTDLRQSTSTNLEEEDPPIIKANPMPDFSKVFVPVIAHKTTEVVPFSFETRPPIKQSLVQQILDKDKENKPLKANPLPSFSTPSLPPKCSKQPTQPQPFNLEAELRGKLYWAKFQEQMETKGKKAREEAQFVARDCNVLEQEPFVPEKSTKPLTEIERFVLHTEIQSEQRKKFEMERKLREEMMMKEEQERRALKEAEELKALNEYRESLVHKAQPVHHYAPIEIHCSDKPITVPVSPKLCAGSRLRT